MKEILFGVAGMLLTAVIAFVTAWLTSRQNRAASRETNSIEQEKVDAKAFHDAEGFLRRTLDDLKDELDDLRAKQKADRERLREQGDRIDELERARASDRRRMQAAIRYIAQLRSGLLAAGLPVPLAPDELAHDLDSGGTHRTEN